jgi:integrase
MDDQVPHEGPATLWGPALADAFHRAARLRHLSRRTEHAYRSWVRRYLAANRWRHPLDLGRDEAVAFLSDLATRHRVSASTQNQALAALLFLYRSVLDRELPWLDDVVRAKRPRRVPVVLSRAEVRSILAHMHGQPGLVATLPYGSGLRLLEALQLRIKDVDLDGRLLTIRSGKAIETAERSCPTAPETDSSEPSAPP